VDQRGRFPQHPPCSGRERDRHVQHAVSFPDPLWLPPADSQTFSPLTELFTEHTAPEYLESRWASLICKSARRQTPGRRPRQTPARQVNY